MDTELYECSASSLNSRRGPVFPERRPQMLHAAAFLPRLDTAVKMVIAGRSGLSHV